MLSIVSAYGRSATSLPEHVPATIGTNDDQIYQDEHKVVMPARCLFAPEACVPDEDLPVDRSQHDQYQTDRGKLREHAEGYSQPTGKFSRAQKHCEGRAHADALRAALRVSEVAPAAGDKDCRNHKPQQQQAEVSELRELWEHQYLLSRTYGFQVLSFDRVP
jgi:hypothetical protein